MRPCPDNIGTLVPPRRIVMNQLRRLFELILSEMSENRQGLFAGGDADAEGIGNYLVSHRQPSRQLAIGFEHYLLSAVGGGYLYLFCLGAMDLFHVKVRAAVQRMDV